MLKSPLLPVVPVPPPPQSLSVLRPYQRDALESIETFVANGGRRGLIVMPTGGGKTILFARLAAALGLIGKTLILVHRDELVTQAFEKCERENPGLYIGIEKGTQRAGPMDMICVASVQTLQGLRLHEFTLRWGIPALIVTDEAHHSTAPSYQGVYTHFGAVDGGTTIHIGVTATPKRGDGIGLDRVYQQVLHATAINDLIGLGWLCDLRGYTVRTTTSLDSLAKKDLDSDKKVSDVIDTPERNASVVRAYQDLAAGRKTVVFAATRDHSKHLAETFTAAGISATWVAGEGANGMPLAERRHRLAGFDEGVFDVVINANVLTEGWDCPAVRCVIIARPITKQGLYAQCIGRGTRLSTAVAAAFTGPLALDTAKAARKSAIATSKKPDCLIIDVLDISKRHRLASLPALLGLPATFNLAGKSATAAAADYEKLMADSNVVGALVPDLATMEQLALLPKEERLAALVKAIKATTQEYVPFDLLAPKPMPAYAQATLTWFEAAPDCFRINLARDSVIVTKNLLGSFDAVWRTKHNEKPVPGSPFETVLGAISTCEMWIKRARGQQTHLIDTTAAWRAKPATKAQRGVLYHAGVKCPKGLTSGQASDVINALTGAGA